MACLSAVSSMRPFGSTTSTCAAPPAACGKTASRRSSASCDSVPGTEKESASLPPKPKPPTAKAGEDQRPDGDQEEPACGGEAAEPVEEGGHAGPLCQRC